MNFARLARTLVHLQAGQVFNRFVRRSPRRKDVDGPVLAPRGAAAPWRNFAPHPNSMLSPTCFRFLSQTLEIDSAECWNSRTLPRLWIYNLHYFDDLLSETTLERRDWQRDAMARWIAENPPVVGAGWEPYPLSRRTVNWIAYALMGAPLPEGFFESLTLQGRALRKQIEYHLRGNHIFVNAKALIFLGCFLSGKEADEWRTFGMNLLRKELAEQILADGAHFELSPMYHALLTEDILDLVQLGRLYPSITTSEIGRWRSVVIVMLDWLAAMSHPDGEIGLFNDSTFHEARNHEALVYYAKGLDLDVIAKAPGSKWLEDSGYIRLVEGPWTAIFDAAPVGAAYIPGHGHADTLSVEISVGDERLITNGGTSTYQADDLRLAERSTISHATVTIDDLNSSEVWSSFRVGRRARPLKVSLSSDGLKAHAAHDGYRFLPGKPIHMRTVEATGNRISVIDAFQGAAKHKAVGRFPLHPSVLIEAESGNGLRLRTASGRMIEVRVEGGVQYATIDGHFSPEFGIRLPRKVLTWQKNEPLGPVTTTFELISS